MQPKFSLAGPFLQHPLEVAFNAPAWDILSAVERGFRARVDVKGKLAEWFLFKELESLRTQGVLDSVTWHDADGRPDFDLVVQGRTFQLECKNVRSGKNPKNIGENYRVEIQKTRNAVGGGPSRGYRIDEFDILAACLFNQGGAWNYLFVRPEYLARRPNHPDYLEIMQTVPTSPERVWKGTVAEILRELAPEMDG